MAKNNNSVGKGFVSFKYIVISLLNDKGFDHKFSRPLLQWVFDCWNNYFNQSLTHFVKVAYLDVDAVMFSVDLPDDYLDYSVIGVRKNGQVHTLSINTDMTLPRGSNCDGPIRDDSEKNNGGYMFYPHMYNGQYFDNLYGVGGGFNDASYRIDLESSPKRIYFQGNIMGKLVLEYIGTESDATVAIVPRLAIEPIKDWVLIKYYQRIGDLKTADYYERQLMTNEAVYNSSLYSLNKDELLDVLESSVSDIW